MILKIFGGRDVFAFRSVFWLVLVTLALFFVD